MAPADSDDEHAHSEDEDVLREEEDAEALLQPESRSWLGRLGGASDPNQPRHIPAVTPREARRQRRRERRAARRQARRGGLANDDETGLLFGQAEKPDSGSDSEGSGEGFPAAAADRRGKARKFRLLLALAAVIAVVVGLAVALTRTSEPSTSTDGTPADNAAADDSKTTTVPLRSNGTHNFAPTTILISLDGFRADFLARNITPALARLIHEGASPKHMLPAFPSLTFPNHWTLATGLHPESHGVVGNSFWDPALQEEFWYTDPARSNDPKWWVSTGAEPLWAAAERQGVRAAVHMWPGSEAGITPAPTFLDPYNGKEPLPRKVDRVLGLLDLPGEWDDGPTDGQDLRPQLICLYVPDVDSAGHREGPNSTAIRDSIVAADDMVGALLAGLEARRLRDVVNVVVVSDHGMATVDAQRLFQYEDLVGDPALVAHIDGWPLYGLRPAPGVELATLHARLVSATADNPWLSVYLRDGSGVMDEGSASAMPAAWHFGASPRIAPLWLIPAPGAAVVRRDDFDLRLRPAGEYPLRGLHGYDHRHPLMRAIFAARGPAFPHPAHSELAVFQNVEVYNLVCDSIGIEPRPNNGTLRLPLVPIGTHGKPPHDVHVPADPPAEDELGVGDEVADGSEDHVEGDESGEGEDEDEYSDKTEDDDDDDDGGSVDDVEGDTGNGDGESGDNVADGGKSSDGGSGDDQDDQDDSEDDDAQKHVGLLQGLWNTVKGVVNDVVGFFNGD